MSNFTTFAVAGGSGMAGRGVVAGLLSAGASRVVVLSRSAETKVPSGAEVSEVDFTSLDSLKAALEGVQVVISCFRDGQDTQEPLLARAAKAAGAQLFLPSDFGSDYDRLEPGSPLYHKKEIGSLLKEIGLPALRFDVGCFPETTFAPARFGWDFTKGKVEIIGTGDEPWSFTTCRSIGTFLGSLLTSLPPSQLVTLGKVVIEGDRLTCNEVVAIYRSLHPDKPLAVSHTSIADSEAYAATLEGFPRFTRWGATSWAKGWADVTQGGKLKLSNELVPEWQPDKVKDYLATLEDVPSEGRWAWYDERQ